MMNELVKMTNALEVSGYNEFKNAELRNAAAEIADLAARGTDGMNRLYNAVVWDIARKLAEIDGKDIYKEDGFANCAEFAMKTFGYGKTMAYALIKAGKRADIIKALPNGEMYTVGQVMELPKDDKELTAMTESGEIGPDMTAKEIREAVKKSPTKPRVRPEIKYQFVELGNDDNNFVMTMSEFEHDCAEIGILWVEMVTHNEAHYMVGVDANYRPVMWERSKLAKPEKSEK